VRSALASAVALVLFLLAACAGTPTPAEPGKTEKPAAASVPEPAFAPEPDGYWNGPINGAVPATIRGGRVIHATDLAELLKTPGVVLVDASNAPKRPEQLAPGAPWLPLPHPVIPGTLWIPESGLGNIPPEIDAFYRNRLIAATNGDPLRTVVVYCHERCWLSWNAARRTIIYGYRDVRWFPEGIEGWRAAGFPTITGEAETPTPH
jgi:PQQ-dependent catabolism-associated CXXCW motif protein